MVGREWLDRDPRLRASILIPSENPELAVAEIERRADDRRFVQVLMWAMNELPLGRRFYWPIYRAAERHGLPIGVHAGSLYRHAPSSIGWGSYLTEDYVLQSAAFESQLLSLVSEGAFAKFPDLKVVFMKIRVFLAARVSVARQQDLARRAQRSPVGEATAGGYRASPRALHRAAGR